MIRVLVVDDSVVFRSQISASLSSIQGVEVVGTASNGKIALDKLRQGSIDLITLDMEMPEMDGMETLRQLKKNNFNVKVIVFSSQTVQGAEKALLALKEGAHDVVAKPSGDGINFETASQAISEVLVPKILQFTQSSLKPKIVNSEKKRKKISEIQPKIIVIASSTGGPGALEEFFLKIKAPLNIPILIAQHMPPVFTQILAKRLSDVSVVPVKEAEHLEKLQPGMAYIAPGDFHMLIKKNNSEYRVELNQAPQRNSVRPAADFLFESAADLFQDGCLGIVLTGMGSDGAVGSEAIKKNNGLIIIQEKESCVVFGMPGAVFEADHYDYMEDIDGIVKLIEHTQTSKVVA